jgi:predicted small metal-binding protein
MKTMKCQECGGEFQAVKREEILKTLYNHYMEAHPEVIPNATDAEKKTWMDRFEKEWTAAEEV